MSVEMAGVTLRQLMDMSAGFADERMTPSILTDVFDHDGDAVAFILKRGLASPPGEAFAYSSSASHLVTAVLAAALERVDGVKPRSVLDYAEEKLFKPLEIDARNAFSSRFRPSKVSEFERAGFGWGTDAQGLHSGCCLLRLRPVDMVSAYYLICRSPYDLTCRSISAG
jgi:CubicO group peptidase (beta-lactamase class C family)